MARNSTFERIIEMVRAEAKLSTDTSVGVESLTYIKQLINRTYEVLWDEFEWSFTALRREDCFKTLAAGQRYYDFPADLDSDAVEGAWVYNGGVWNPIDYGVSLDQYASVDSETDERSDPVLRWVVRDDDQFEVWPIPASNGDLIGFSGKRKFVRLSANADRCEMDDTLVALLCASEILSAAKDGSAPQKVALAQARLDKLRGKASGNGRFVMGRGDQTAVDLSKVMFRAVYNDPTP